MLLLKTNKELKKVFARLIGTIKAPVEWTDTYAIINNNLILVGKVRSLIFNFDNKKVYTNILDIPAEDKNIEQLPDETLINNILNMTLYAFGKWGSIGGLKVEKDYAALNELFQNVFRPIRVEPGFRTENFHFFKNGVQITYEEAVYAALKLLKEEGRMPEEGKKEEKAEEDESADSENGSRDEEKNNIENEETNPAEETDNDGYELGLWHNMRWKLETCTFEKHARTQEDTVKSRIGNDFYMTDYECPECGEKLYMGVYPVDRELLIETEEARVYMARAYACNTCNAFYTPRPGKLLQEGDVYSLKFEEDRIAYEDYLELLGKRITKTVNYKFNEYEFERNAKKTEKEKPQIQEGNLLTADGRAPETNDRQEYHGKSSGIKARSHTETESQYDKVKNTKKEKETAEKRETGQERKQSADQKQRVEQVPEQTAEQAAETASKKALKIVSGAGNKEKLAVKTTEELKQILKSIEQGENRSMEPEEKEAYEAEVKKVLREKLTAKYDARMGALNNLNSRQLSELKSQIQEETILSGEEKEAYTKKITGRLYAAHEKGMEQRIERSKNKTYEEIIRIEEEVQKSEAPEELKEETLRKLKNIKTSRAEREVEHLILHMPLHLDRKQLAAYVDKIKQYKEVDITPYRRQLEQKQDMAEKEEIAAFVKRGGKKDRNALWDVYGQLKEQDYKKENKEPFLEKIYDKIRKMDKEELAKICPDIAALSFEEGLKAYEKIKESMILPELKTNTLEMIERRLTKLKTDESVQLMRKLKRDMEEKMPDFTGFYFYDAREEQKKEHRQSQENDSLSEDGISRKPMYRAVNGYASERSKYEYPLLICDTSRSGSGKEGFVLTPDHIFYRTFLNAGKVSVVDIEEVEENKGLLTKGIYLQRFTGKSIKLPNNIKQENREAFVGILNSFVDYLQEKPESRSISYLAKEKHEVKCCYRCGYTYKGGNVCPKCGSKMNN